MTKRLLSGAAAAALFALAGHAWAQSPPGTTTAPSAAPSPSYSSGLPNTSATAPSPAMPMQASPQRAPAAQAPAAAAAPGGATMSQPGSEQAMGSMPMKGGKHHAMRSRHGRRHAGQMASRGARRGGQSNDNVADQLNREEAGRLMSGSSAAPGGAGMAPGQMMGPDHMGSGQMMGPGQMGPGQMGPGQMPPGQMAPGTRPSGR